jgi:hypothetical protein
VVAREGSGELMFNRYTVWNDEKVLEMDEGGTA